MNKRLQADLMLLAVTAGWGSSYLFMKQGLESLQEFNLIALRFGIAFCLAFLALRRQLSAPGPELLRAALLLGTLLFGVFAAILFGIRSTSTANAGFLVGLTVVFVPLFSSLRRRRFPAPGLFCGVCLSLAGIALLTLHGSLAIGAGDLLCMGGAVFYALHILATGFFAHRHDALSLGVLQLGVVALWGALGTVFWETPRLPSSHGAWAAILALSIVCSAIGFVVQTVAQKHTTPSHTGLIFSLEPVFAALFAFAFASETLSPQGYLGAALVLCGILSAEFWPQKAAC